MDGERLTVEAPSLDAELVGRLLYRRDLALARHRGALAKALRVTDTELLALVHLAQQGDLAPSRIADLLDLSSGGATALIQRLERGGHVTRHSHPADRRSTLIRLTSQTAERLAEGDASLGDALGSLAADLTEEQQATVARFLAQVADLSEELAQSERRDVAPVGETLRRPVPSLWA